MSILPSQFQQFTINYYNGQDPYKNGQLTAEGEVLLTQFAAMLASIPEDQRQTPAQLNALYLQFLAQKTMDVRVSEASNALSPDEISQRHIVYNVYEILLTLLNTITTNEIATSAVLNFLAQKQKNYSDMMGKTSMYIGTGTIYTQDDSRGVSSSYSASTADAVQTQIHSSATDATQFTLGYMNISVDDISQYLTDQVFRQNQPSSSFDIYSDAWPIDPPTSFDEERNHATMTITNNGDGTCTATASFTQEGHNISTGNWDTLNTYSISSNPVPISTTTFTKAQSAMDSTFLSLYAWAKGSNMVEISAAQLTPDEQKGSAIEQAYDIAERNIKISWGSTPITTPDVLKNPDIRPAGILAYNLSPETTDPTWLSALSTIQQTRDQYNKTLTTYIGQAEAAQQLLGDKATQQQQVVQAATSSREMTNKILKSTIQQMSTILQSMFK